MANVTFTRPDLHKDGTTVYAVAGSPQYSCDHPRELAKSQSHHPSTSTAGRGNCGTCLVKVTASTRSYASAVPLTDRGGGNS